jgi:putative GTP pyrophosphokinase
VFQQITDIAGVRVLHLYLEQLRQIDDAIRNKDWIFVENPKAYSWDPETIDFMKQLQLETHFKESFYTSVHYVVRPNPTSPLSCEIQVRTLFEEIWGEVDHMLNYPTPTSIFTSSEQLKVLAKIVGAGSRSVDSLFKTHAAALQSTPSVSKE